MGYCRPMGYGQQFPANGLGGRLKLWDKRGYGLRQVWVKRGLTVFIFIFESAPSVVLISLLSSAYVVAAPQVVSWHTTSSS